MMQPDMTGRRRTDFQLLWHRRVGLTSFVCLLLGTAWVSSVVLPGLPKNSDPNNTKLAGSGAFNALSLFGSRKVPDVVPIPVSSPSTTAPAIGTAEIALVDAPVGSALQLLLASARFSCSTDPAVTGVVNYSCVGSPKPFWEVLGRVIGASPAPGVHVAAIWDSYRVLPRDIKPLRMRDYSSSAVPEPSPVPLSESRVSHRMVGYVSLKPSDEQPALQLALMETRIPGVSSQWRLVRAGDSLQRKSSRDTARETNPAANIDVAVAVTEVSADHLTLQGGGNKSLRVPLSASGVTDIFGFSSVAPSESTGNFFEGGQNPRPPSDWHQ
ncbi:MAG: hypothetical protein H8F28_15170 [Fibrella sp.]|nr:hypothetical protein [Armatimonadota bacterium]